MTSRRMLASSKIDAATTVRIRLERDEMGIFAFRARLGPEDGADRDCNRWQWETANRFYLSIKLRNNSPFASSVQYPHFQYFTRMDRCKQAAQPLVEVGRLVRHNPSLRDL